MPSREQTTTTARRRRHHAPPAAAPAVLTGPGVEGIRYPAAGVAISAAITAASAALEPCTYYVRDPDGRTLVYVERHPGRTTITVHTVNNPHKETHEHQPHDPAA